MCLSVPGQLVAIHDENPLNRIGKVSFSGVCKDVSLIYVPEAKLGDYLTIHVGFALSIIDEEKALDVFKSLNELKSFNESIDKKVVPTEDT